MPKIQASTLRPGLLVSLKTSVVGNVRYTKQVIEDERTVESGAALKKWETERTIMDPVEFERSGKVRGKAAGLVRAVCSQSAFGLLCPEDAGEKLDAAVAAARKLIEEFNADAKVSRIHLYVIAGRVAADDVEAVKAINSEVRDLMREMEKGMTELDVKAIREAASRAKGLAAMLTGDAQARIQIAIEAARSTAKDIVKADDASKLEPDKWAIKKVAEQRAAFLDLDGGGDVGAPVQSAPSLDLAEA